MMLGFKVDIATPAKIYTKAKSKKKPQDMRLFVSNLKMD
jgi:hypothetical protein